MAPLLRRRLVCFYCGRRSAQSKSSELRRWECENCEAVNHLDANGEITDPPASETNSNLRYAQPIKRPITPLFEGADEGLFCKACIQNQYMLSRKLAEYLPAATDLNYDLHEQEYPKFKQRLEEEHPPVCTDCAPRVQERIRATGYAAKTDHLRRMMEKTRGGPRYGSQWTLWRVMVMCGAMLWWFGLVTQLFWHGLGLLDITQALSKSKSQRTVQSCLLDAARSRTLSLACSKLLVPVECWSVFAAVCGIWWNPTQSLKARGVPGRVTGASEYYKLQGILNVARISVWYACDCAGGLILDAKTTKAVHVAMLVLNLVVSLVSYRTVYLDATPKVSFQESPLNLKSGPSRGPNFVTATISPASQSSSTPAFQIGSLAPSQPIQPTQPVAPRYQPPTPPPDDDAMDIDTPQKVFQPTPSIHLHQPTPKRAEPSPFYGKLPPAPFGQERMLRNPPNKPGLRKVSAQEQENFFNSMTKAGRSPVPGLDEEPPTPGEIVMAKQRFFAGDSDTGLETMFDGVFSLDDEPPEVREARKRHESWVESTRSLHAPGFPWMRLSSVLILLVADGAWYFHDNPAQIPTSLRFWSLPFAIAVAAGGLVNALDLSQPFWKLSDILIQVMEVLLASFLVYSHGFAASVPPQALVMIRLPQALLGVMTIQELQLLVSAVRTPSTKIPDDTARPKPALTTAAPSRTSVASSSIAPSSVYPESSQPEVANYSAPQRHRRQSRESLGSSAFSGLSLSTAPNGVSTGAKVAGSTWSNGAADEVTRRKARMNGGAVRPWERGTL